MLEIMLMVLVASTEKALKEHGDKVSADKKK